jgi:membrane fusion protein (multidrug efflux system)
MKRAALERTLSVLPALALVAACKAQTAAPQPQPQVPQVSVVTVHRQDVPVVVQLPGRTAASLTAQVRARVDGLVLERTYKEGSEVKAGQPLYQIDPKPYVAQLQSAQASLQKAQANLASTRAQAERYKILVAANAVSKQDYDNAVAARGQAEADVAAARASVETARLHLGYTKVISPITGRSGLSQVTQGAYVQSGAATLLTTVQQIDPIYVDLEQSSAEGLRLRRELAAGGGALNGPEQAKVTLLLEDGTQYEQTGSLQASDVSVDPGTGSVTVRAVFPNPDSVLLPGMFVRARIEGGLSEKAFLVSQAGVTHNQKGQATALIVGPDDKVALRTLQTAGTRGDQWIVEGGLEDGDRVIVSGLQKVQPGITVQAVEAPARAAPAAPDAGALPAVGGAESAGAGGASSAK